MRVFIIYLFSYLTLAVYGGQVCPFIEGLGLTTFAIELLIFFVVSLGARYLLVLSFLKKEKMLSKNVFYIEFSVFVLLGLILTVFNSIYYHFPLGSGLKVLIGTVTLGIFSGIDMSLAKLRENFEKLKNESFTIQHEEKYTSFIKKFSIIALFITSIFMAIIILIIVKDLEWLVSLGQSGIKSAIKYVIIEVVFLVAVLSFLIINAVISYSRNLKLLFNNLTDALSKITNGNLDVFLPVISNDEIGAIARHTNSMVEGLKEKDMIKSVLGKTTSPEIAEILIEQEKQGIQLGGSRRELAILMADIRNFTSFSEKQEPEKTINLLNRYFSKVVEKVTENRGILDKFIGDGCLALFGFRDMNQAANEAVQAGLEILAIVQNIEKEIGQTFKVGVGIHLGSMVAGIIGSEDRLEYTVIGDAVNTVSRIEGATKALNHSILISKSVFERISQNLKNLNWTKIESHPLRGKTEKIDLFGL